MSHAGPSVPTIIRDEHQDNILRRVNKGHIDEENMSSGDFNGNGPPLSNDSPLSRAG